MHDVEKKEFSDTRKETSAKSTDFNVTAIRKKLRNLSDLENHALDDCHTLFVETVNVLQSAVKGLKGGKVEKHDLQTLLSAAMTNQATCLDGFAFSKSRNKIRRYFRKSLRDISRQVSNSLALLKKINGTSKAKTEAFPEYGKMSGSFPQWVQKKERALLQTATNDIISNLVVAKDGSGNFTTIGDALNAAPNFSTTRFVIYIKAGAYYEYLELDSGKRMIMFVGDGIGKTLIKGNRSVAGNWTTYRSATV
ncbi:pectinesterase, catalytic, partial [Tanacetum coccineum]